MNVAVWTYDFTPGDLATARDVALARQGVHDRAGRHDGKIMPASGASVHFLGAAAELAFSRLTGLPWDTAILALDEWHAWRAAAGGDVCGFHLRATPLFPPAGRLVIRPGDPPAGKFVLCDLSRLPTIAIFRGWCAAREAPHLGRFVPGRYGRPAYYVPWERLHAMPSLLPDTAVGYLWLPCRAPGQSIV